MKILKSRILLVIVTIILTGSISVYAAGRYYANQVDYEPSNPNFNVDNMADALDELYDKTKNYKNLSTPTDVNPSNLLSGIKAYNSNGELVTGNISTNCVSGKIEKGSGHRQLTNFKPSTFLVFSLDNGKNWGNYYNYEYNTTDQIDFNISNKIITTSKVTAYTISNNGLYIDWDTTSYNNLLYIACK